MEIRVGKWLIINKIKCRRAVHGKSRKEETNAYCISGINEGYSFGAETIHFGAETIHSARPLQFLTAALYEPL